MPAAGAAHVATLVEPGDRGRLWAPRALRQRRCDARPDRCVAGPQRTRPHDGAAGFVVGMMAGSRIAALAGKHRRAPEATGGEAATGRLFRTAGVLMLNTGLTAALGFGFWILAARLYSPQEVGINSAIIAILVTVSTLAQVNLGSVFVRFLPETARPARLILVGYAVAAGLSIVAATAVLLIASRVAKPLSVLESNHVLGVVWVTSVALWCVFALQDAALTGLRTARWVPVENALFGTFKLAFLVLLAALGTRNGMFLAWVLPMAILVVPVNVIIFRHAVPAHTPAHDEGVVGRFGRRRLIRYLGMSSVASSIDQGTLAALPILVVGILGGAQNAYFFIAFTIVTTYELLADNVITALTVEGVHEIDRLKHLTRAVTRRLMTLMIPATIVLIIAAPLVLRFFGETYVQHSTSVLRLLALASILRGAIWLFMTVARIQGDGFILLAASAAASVSTIVFAVVFAGWWGVNGVGFAWLLSNALVAIVVIPMLWRFMRHPDGSDGALGSNGERPAPLPDDTGLVVSGGGWYRPHRDAAGNDDIFAAAADGHRVGFWRRWRP